MNLNHYSLDKHHVMVDLETLDIGPNARILSIGACTVFGEYKEFYSKASCPALVKTEYPFSVSQSTIDWWLKQDPQIRAETFSGTQSISSLLDEFKLWISGISPDVIVWGNGANFDIACLEYAFKVYGHTVPWGYKNIGCYRTLNQLIGDQAPTPPDNTSKHNALEDAKWQAARLHWMLTYLGDVG